MNGGFMNAVQFAKLPLRNGPFSTIKIAHDLSSVVLILRKKPQACPQTDEKVSKVRKTVMDHYPNGALVGAFSELAFVGGVPYLRVAGAISSTTSPSGVDIRHMAETVLDVLQEQEGCLDPKDAGKLSGFVTQRLRELLNQK